MYSVYYNHIKTTDVLIQRGANHHIKTADGISLSNIVSLQGLPDNTNNILKNNAVKYRD